MLRSTDKMIMCAGKEIQDMKDHSGAQRNTGMGIDAEDALLILMLHYLCSKEQLKHTQEF